MNDQMKRAEAFFLAEMVRDSFDRLDPKPERGDTTPEYFTWLGHTDHAVGQIIDYGSGDLALAFARLCIHWFELPFDMSKMPNMMRLADLLTEGGANFSGITSDDLDQIMWTQFEGMKITKRSQKSLDTETEAQA